MFRLMYSSVAAMALDTDELEALLGTSRRNNQQDDVTGVLLHVVTPDRGTAAFVQVLEGDAAAVERVYARIEADELHTGLSVLHRGSLRQRAYAGWSMRLEEVEDGDGDVVGSLRDADAVERLVRRHTP
jgi:hypothetical protein